MVTRFGVPVTPAVDAMEMTWPEFLSMKSGRNSNSVQNCEYTFTWGGFY
jgi:hypothetical protein